MFANPALFLGGGENIAGITGSSLHFGHLVGGGRRMRGEGVGSEFRNSLTAPLHKSKEIKKGPIKKTTQ